MVEAGDSMVETECGRFERTATNESVDEAYLTVVDEFEIALRVGAEFGTYSGGGLHSINIFTSPELFSFSGEGMNDKRVDCDRPCLGDGWFKDGGAGRP